jgi:cyclophilin family peptidyl-prolyl cis-trans isomerase
MGHHFSVGRCTLSWLAAFVASRHGQQRHRARRHVPVEPRHSVSTESVHVKSISLTCNHVVAPRRLFEKQHPEERTPLVSRRETWNLAASGVLTSAACMVLPTTAVPGTARAVEATETMNSDATTATAKITDIIYFDVSFGLVNTAADQSAESAKSRHIVVGLFGNEAPDSAARLLKLASKSGLSAPCRPRAVRQLQREQLQANAVYSRCKEFESVGVTLQDSTIWRIVPGERVDLGAVSGKFLAREYPTWSDTNSLRHDAFGVVSVRKGNQGGFGVTITLSDKPNDELDDLNVVIGRVIDGVDALREINSVPIIKAAKQLNYKALSGGDSTKDAPSRSCTYGGPLYCNENKPLIKLTVSEVGVL